MNKQNLHEFLDQSFARFRALPPNGVESACDRVLNRLREQPVRGTEIEVSCLRPPARYGRWFVVFATATATLVFAQQFVTRRQAQTLPVPTPIVVPVPQVPVDPPKPPASTPPQLLRFAVASVKTITPATMMPGAGLACHGVDGVQRILLTVTDAGLNAVKAPQGRCVGSGVFLSTLIEFAYGVHPRNILGGPDWVRTTGFLTVDTLAGTAGKIGAITTIPVRGNNEGQVAWITESSMQIEAAADDPTKATLGQLRQMIRTMLNERFGLQFHRERRETPGYSLVVAEGGHKVKSIFGDYEESTVLARGKSTLDKLARTLSSVLLEEFPVVDKTGLTGAYEYELRLLPLTPAPLDPDRPGSPPTPKELANILSAKVEEQLGLRLQAEPSIPIEVLVIDSVNHPTPN
jgi:uncharacterized protein (TIGR03435 family)